MNTVDVYDAAADTWTTADLTNAVYEGAGAATSTKVIFAGGSVGSGAVLRGADIYDVSSGTWSYQASALSAGRVLLAAAGTPSRAFFAGGKYVAAACCTHVCVLCSQSISVAPRCTRLWTSTTQLPTRGATPRCQADHAPCWRPSPSMMSSCLRAALTPSGALSPRSTYTTSLHPVGVMSRHSAPRATRSRPPQSLDGSRYLVAAVAPRAERRARVVASRWSTCTTPSAASGRCIPTASVWRGTRSLRLLLVISLSLLAALHPAVPWTLSTCSTSAPVRGPGAVLVRFRSPEDCCLQSQWAAHCCLQEAVRRGPPDPRTRMSTALPLRTAPTMLSLRLSLRLRMRRQP